MYQDKTLLSIKGTILEIYPEYFRIKLEDGNFIQVPLIFFDSSLEIKTGSSLSYVIKQKINGIKYQEIMINS